MSVDGCMACDVLRGKLKAPGGTIYEDSYWVVDHSVSPILLPGFLIVKLKRHCENLSELTGDEMAALAVTLKLTCTALEKVLRPARTYVCSFGESVKHVHFYVIPRLPGIPSNGLDVLRGMFESHEWAASDEKAAIVAGQVRSEIQLLTAKTSDGASGPLT